MSINFTQTHKSNPEVYEIYDNKDIIGFIQLKDHRFTITSLLKNYVIYTKDIEDKDCLSENNKQNMLSIARNEIHNHIDLLKSKKERNRLPKEILDRIKLVKTCQRAPELYEMYLDGNDVAKLRLRHGVFTVTEPNGKVLYEGYPVGNREFDDDERLDFITTGVRAVLKSKGIN